MRAVAAALALAVALAAGPARALPPVWVVRDADSEMVLFGAMHLLPPNVDWRPPALTQALPTADDIWFEAPTGAAAAEGAQIAQRLGILPPGQSLMAKLSRRDAQRLRRVCAKYRCAVDQLDRLRPWYAEAILVQGVLAAQTGASLASGVEDQIDAAAPPGAQRRAFAGNADHMAMLAAGDEREQIASLRQTLAELERGPGAYNRLLAAWLRGDVRWIARHAVETERREAPAQFQRLVTDRNARWATQLDARLKGKGRTVVVVGFGHLVGPGSLPARLRALGYSVEGP